MTITTRTVPKGLSTEAKGWWNRLRKEFGIDDDAGLLLLQTSLEALDRMRECQAAVRRDGPTERNRFGEPRPHHLLVVERDARAQMLAALKALNLDVEPLRDGPGRPPGR
jgi:P27 family predicted phage terminase small subunit